MPPRFLRSPSRGGFSYAANVGEYGFCELRLYGVLRSSL
jgi:hypothetical protein